MSLELHPIQNAIAECLPPSGNIWVGLSGGLDSSVLLHAARYAVPEGRQLSAVHVNHNLQVEAGDWQQHCEQVCAQWQIPLTVQNVDVAVTGQGTEAAAREARYQAFAECLQEGDCLLLGQHLQDQAETVLLRLLRGSGPRGLAAMREYSELPNNRDVKLLRPLLGFERSELQFYGETHGLRWIEDPSNSSLHYDRNYLRHRILPLLAERWPGYMKTLARSADLCADEMQNLETLQQLDYESVSHGRQTLDIPHLLALPEQRQRGVLRYWLERRQIPMPSLRILQQVQQQLATAGDRQIVVAWRQWQVRRHRQQLYVLQAHKPLNNREVYTWENKSAVLPLTDNGQLSLSPATSQSPRQCLLAHTWKESAWQIAYRQGGERCQPVGRPHSQTLKRLLQEYDIPPWLRERLPLLFIEGELAAVADIWVCEKFAARDDEDAVVIQWQSTDMEG